MEIFPPIRAKRVIRADGISGVEMLKAVLLLIPLDTYSDLNMILMQLMACDEGKINPVIWGEYEKIARAEDENVKIGNIDRFEFYERAKNAYAVIATGEETVYANIILKKGVMTMNMAESVAKLIEENVFYSNGEHVKVIIADTTIGRAAEAAAWNAFGMDKESQDYRACQTYGPMYKNIK